MARDPVTKHTFNLREGDVDYLTQVYGPKAISVSHVIRQLVSSHVDKLRKQEASSGSVSLNIEVDQ